MSRRHFHVHPQPRRNPRNHLIADYKVALDRVECTCAWVGTVETWDRHKAAVRRTERGAIRNGS